MVQQVLHGGVDLDLSLRLLSHGLDYQARPAEGFGHVQLQVDLAGKVFFGLGDEGVDFLGLDVVPILN